MSNGTHLIHQGPDLSQLYVTLTRIEINMNVANDEVPGRCQQMETIIWTSRNTSWRVDEIKSMVELWAC